MNLTPPTTTVHPNRRDRQRALISSLEQDVADKLDALRLLAAENEVLRLRSSVLENAVKGREMQVGWAAVRLGRRCG